MTYEVDGNPSSLMKGLPVFHGEAEKYQEWKLKFREYANAKGFSDGLEPLATYPPANHADVASPGADEKTKWIKVNDKAFAYYTLALEGDQVFQMIMASCTTEFPLGLAYLIGRKLDAHYQPHDLLSAILFGIEMENQLSKVKMGDTDSPALMFNHLASIKVAYSYPGHVIPDEKFYTTIIRAAPSNYDQAILVALNAATVSLDSIQVAMMKKFRYIVAKNPKLGGGKLSSQTPMY